MVANVNGFKLNVTVIDGIPHVRVWMKDEVVIETNRLSITGLQNMAKVFEAAADGAFRELEDYYARQS